VNKIIEKYEKEGVIPSMRNTSDDYKEYNENIPQGGSPTTSFVNSMFGENNYGDKDYHDDADFS